MTALRSSSFSSPAMPGDDIAVFFLVEDSGAMAGIWDDVRAFYLPMLLENLRTADMTVAMQVSWMTSSPTSSPSTVLVNDPAQCRDIPDFPFNPTMGTAISSAVVRRSIDILSSAREGRQTTRHFILIAATAPPPVDERYGFDPWHDVAVALCQEYIRLHVILNAGPDMRIFHDLFKRSLHLQNNSEIPSWFQIDPRTYSIRLSGRPQYVRDPAAPIQVPQIEHSFHDDSHGNPATPATPTSPTIPSSPTSPSTDPTTPTRRSSTSPSLSRAKPRNADAPSSPSSPTEGPGLVSYLQQMHGLTKKRSYGVRAPKRSLGVDLRLPNTTRPILPRLELPQSTVYTYPTFPSAHTPDAQVSVSESPKSPTKRHAEEQPSSSLVARSNADNRRARRRGPWLPVAPLDSPAPTSASPNSSTRNALRHLASMTPRLPDILAAERQPADPPAAQPSYPPFQPVGHGVDASYPPAYFDTREQPVVWSHNQPVLTAPAASPPDAPAGDKLFLQYHIARQLPGNPYSNSPMSSQSATPLPSPGLAAPASSGGGDAEDQPFVVTPEYEAFVNAQFEEAIRSGAMQASMTVTSALHSPISGLPSYAADMPLQQEQFVTASSPLAQEPFGAEQEGYPFYPPYVAIATGPVAQNGGESWQGGGDYAHAHNAAADYGAQPGWYPA